MSIPKAILYYDTQSVWSSSVLLALEEKGYGADELVLKIVDLSRGEHFDPTYLRINPKATVPALVVPLDKTLSEDIESRYRAITETKAILEFLDKSRSAQSHTNTTSNAPAPSLAPATISFNSTSEIIIGALHQEGSDPTQLKWLNVPNEGALPAVAKAVLPALTGRYETITKLLDESTKEEVSVSSKVRNLWQKKSDSLRTLLDVLNDAEKSKDQLDADALAKRQEYLVAANDAWQKSLKSTLQTAEKEIVGPLVLGEQCSLADLHLATYLTRIASLVGASSTDKGADLVTKIDARVGGGLSTESKLVVFWDTFKERSSWKKVYAEGLH